MTNIVSFKNAKNIKNAIDNTEFRGDANSLDSALFPIEVRDVFLGDAHFPKHKGIYRTDTNQPLSIVGKDYKVVTNEEVFTAYEDGLLNSGLDTTGMKRVIDLAGNGAKTYVRYQLPAHSVTVADNGDKTVLEFCAINSYDANSSFTHFYGGYRLICSNGQVWGENLGYSRNRHTKNLNIKEGVDKFRIAAEHFVAMGDCWNKWASVKMSPTKATEILLGNKFAPRLAEKIVQQFEREAVHLGHTQWALYNAITHWSTHTAPSKGAELNAPSVRERRENDTKRILNSKQWLMAA